MAEEVRTHNDADKENVSGIWRVINRDEDTTYLIRTDVVNAADSVHTDIHDRKSRGYGGAEFRYRLVDGSLYTAKGPWHSSAHKLYDVTDGYWNVGDLCFTRVSLTNEFGEIYAESEDVLGPFMRGRRMAQQLAVVMDCEIGFKVTSNGGSSAGVAYPDKKYEHPMSRRKGDTKHD